MGFMQRLQLARDELGELLGGRVDERSARVALARAPTAERRIDRLEAPLVAARGHADQDLLGDARRERVALTQRFDGGQLDLLLALAARSHARALDRHVAA